MENDLLRAFLMRHLTTRGYRAFRAACGEAETLKTMQSWERRYWATFGRKNGHGPLPTEYVFDPEAAQLRQFAPPHWGKAKEVAHKTTTDTIE